MQEVEGAFVRATITVYMGQAVAAFQAEARGKIFEQSFGDVVSCCCEVFKEPLILIDN